MFSDFLGIRPWEWEQLPMHEVRMLIRYVDKVIENAQRKEQP